MSKEIYLHILSELMARLVYVWFSYRIRAVGEHIQSMRLILPALKAQALRPIFQGNCIARKNIVGELVANGSIRFISVVGGTLVLMETQSNRFVAAWIT